MRFTPLLQPVSRRAALLGAPPLVMAGMIGASAGAATPARANFDPDSPEDNLRTYIKLQYSLKPKEPVYSYFGGHVFALDGDLPARLLFEVTGFGQGWVDPQADGTYQMAWKEIGYLRDPVTRQILDKWRNPYIDEDVDVRHIANPAANAVLSARPPKNALGNFGTADIDKPGGNYRHPEDPDAFVLPWTTIGDWTSVWQDARLAMKHTLDPKIWVRESSGERISIGEFVQMYARTSELFDDRRSHVDYTGSWVRVASWHPWMLMGQKPGKLFYRCSIQRLHSPEELPPELFKAIETRNPDFLKQPTEFGPRYSTWKTFLATQKPRPPKVP